jgi:hypothetical protein
LFVIVKEIEKEVNDFNRIMEPFRNVGSLGWEYWTYGGRWDGKICGKSKNKLEVEDALENNFSTVENVLALGIIPYAIITPDGIWHDKEHPSYGVEVYGWENELIEIDPVTTWEDDVKLLLTRYPKHYVVCIEVTE